MRFADVFIRRPVFASMLVGAFVVLGLFSYRTLGVDLFPNIDFPIITVTTTLKGAGVEEMETGVTKVIEEAINTIEGIDTMQSTTREGVSFVIVNFVLEKSREVAAQDVRDKVSAVLAQLPAGTDPPIIDKFDVDAAPVMTVAVSCRRSLREVTELARHAVLDDEELRHPGECRDCAPRHRDRMRILPDHDLGAPEKAGPQPVVRVRHERLERERTRRRIRGGAHPRHAAVERLARIRVDGDADGLIRLHRRHVALRDLAAKLERIVLNEPEDRRPRPHVIAAVD